MKGGRSIIDHLFGVKEEKVNLEERKNVPEALKVYLCPSPGNRFEFTQKDFNIVKFRLNGKIVKVDDELDDLQKAHEDSFEENDNLAFKDFDENVKNFNRQFAEPFWPLIVLYTMPEGVVKITEKTEIILSNELPDEFGFPESKLIRVKTKPNLKAFKEVENLGQLLKIALKGKLVNRFDEKKEIIYFVEKYYCKKQISQ